MGYRYNMMTSNIAESMNAKLKEARKLPITALVDHLREVLQQWFVERRDAASSLNTHLTKWAENKVRKNNNSGLHMRVSPIDLYAFQIHDQSQTFTVDLNNMTCTCREFDLDRLPCAHATVACRFKGVSVYSMCSQFYTANALMLAYAEPIWSVGNKSEWDVSQDVQNKIVLPPIRQVVPGRRKTVDGKKSISPARFSSRPSSADKPPETATLVPKASPSSLLHCWIGGASSGAAVRDKSSS
ncbi:hypothetical protein ACLB2K_022256 [Fragaria x ananassa]